MFHACWKCERRCMDSGRIGILQTTATASTWKRWQLRKRVRHYLNRIRIFQRFGKLIKFLSFRLDDDYNVLWGEANSDLISTPLPLKRHVQRGRPKRNPVTSKANNNAKWVNIFIFLVKKNVEENHFSQWPSLSQSNKIKVLHEKAIKQIYETQIGLISVIKKQFF